MNKWIAALLLTLLAGPFGCLHHVGQPCRNGENEDEISGETNKTVVVGRVTDIAGRPITGARLRTVLTNEGDGAPQDYFMGDHDGKGGRSDRMEAKSDRQGRFTVEAIPGHCRLSVFAAGYASMYRGHQVFKGVNKGWDFALPQSAHVSGRVLDTKGNPMPKRFLQLASLNFEQPPPAPGVGFYTRGLEGIETTHENGVFAMPNLSPGKYVIQAVLMHSYAGFSMVQTPVKGKLIEVGPGDRIQNFEIRVYPPAEHAISGQVRDAKGRPMRQLEVSALGSQTLTGEDGSFRLEGLDFIGASSCPLVFSHHVTIPAVPMNSTNINLVWPDKGGIRGTVRNASTGSSITSFEVSVPIVKLSEAGAFCERSHVAMKGGQDGTFSLTGLPEGEADIVISTEDRGTQRFVTRVVAGKMTELECRMKGPAILEGYTTLNGKPRPTWVILNGEWIYSNTKGHFQFHKQPDGDHTVWFFGDENWHRYADVTLRPGETTHLDMEVGGSCAVTGSVFFPQDSAHGCYIRLAERPAPDGWEGGRPNPTDRVLACTYVNESGGKFQLHNIPPGRYYLMVAPASPAEYRYKPVLSKVVELKEGESLSLDLDLTVPEKKLME